MIPVIDLPKSNIPQASSDQFSRIKRIKFDIKNGLNTLIPKTNNILILPISDLNTEILINSNTSNIISILTKLYS
jgi:hypothetical protein